MTRAGRRRAADVTEEHLARIAAGEGAVHAFNQVTADQARASAATVDARVAAGRDAGPWAGVTVALKDNLCTRGVPTTASSRILAGWRPPYDATVVTRLARAGAVAVGKTNLDEFAMGSSTENSAYQVTRNPWDLGRIPGGSSGGSAAAVAACEAPLALGTDTGGSIRQPASLCGVVGMKPTYGRVSRYGLIAFASSLDQIGPFARSVEDAAIVLEAMAGHDPLDATSSNRPNDVLRDFDAGVKGMRLGVPREYTEVDGIEPGVKAAVNSAIKSLRDAGAEIVDVALPHTDYGLAAFYIIAPAEFPSNLARFAAVGSASRTESASSIAASRLAASAVAAARTARRSAIALASPSARTNGARPAAAGPAYPW